MRFYVDERALRAAGIPEPTVRLLRALAAIDFEPEADTPTATHKLPILIGGTTYYLLLSDS